MFGKGGVFLPTSMKLTFCQKSKIFFLPKNTLKNDITKKGDTHRRKDDIGIPD